METVFRKVPCSERNPEYGGIYKTNLGNKTHFGSDLKWYKSYKRVEPEYWFEEVEEEDENVTISFKYGKHDTVEDRIVMSFDGTGLDIDNPDHKKKLEDSAKTMGAIMYAIANNISVDNIKFNGKS